MNESIYLDSRYIVAWFWAYPSWKTALAIGGGDSQTPFLIH